ncbi:hypothetical protein X801_07481 [Opisthorchis viverrini]|uniref:Uncharacterized protein n=1 Tax=Opisthorchis viverrini TaxID=6198 RepID=A0A1S8WQG1_OPIVI|nr:hypothetical protein X801_07481 [Opisthorchis viverrini]
MSRVACLPKHSYFIQECEGGPRQLLHSLNVGFLTRPVRTPHILHTQCAPADQEVKKLPPVPTEEQCKLKVGERLLQVLPGVGWDNLVNEERGPTIDRDVYSQCRRSSDGRYVVPDDMVVGELHSLKLSPCTDTFQLTES